MAGKVLNIKVCNPPKLRSGLTGNYYAICHYSYNLPLGTSSPTNTRLFKEIKMRKINLTKLYIVLLSITLFITSFFWFPKISNLLIPKIENLNFYSINLNEQFKLNLYFSAIIGITPIFLYFTWKLAKISNKGQKVLSFIFVFIFMGITIFTRQQILKYKFKNLPNLRTETDEIITNTFHIKNLNYEYYLLIGLLLGCVTSYLIFKNKEKKKNLY
jgi:hypothetical protein